MPTMDRERAALLLGVAVDAGRAEVTAAFARRARTAHPDVDGGDAETFRLLVEARDRLLAAGPAPDGEMPLRVVVRENAPRPHGPLLLGAWVGILLVAAFLSVFRVEHPWAPGEPLLRWGLLIAAGWGFGVTGRRVLLVAMSLLFLASVVTTLILTTWGGLVGLLLAIPALYGLALSGEARLRLARDVSA
tara:strand:- start:53782 stop:54351 length:570 start_codon:yes stop_codon:yes gene_type:complete